MSLRHCLIRFHLIGITCLVIISLLLIVIGGSLSAWCLHQDQLLQCYSLFYSDSTFSCLFKLLPVGVIFCLTVSLIMFAILLILQIYRQTFNVIHKEYQNLVRLVNIVVLSISIVLIMIILLQWFYAPMNTMTSILIARVASGNANDINQQKFEFERLLSNDPIYSSVLLAQRQASAKHSYTINHGPNMFVAAFCLLLSVLLIFISMHRVIDEI
jgi:hypothetical protein